MVFPKIFGTDWELPRYIGLVAKLGLNSGVDCSTIYVCYFLGVIPSFNPNNYRN